MELNNFTLGDLRSVIREEVQLSTKEFFTSDEAAAFLGIELSYLYHLTSDMMIPYSKPYGKKMYFARADLIRWALSNRTAGVEEIESRAVTIMATSKKR